MHGSVDTIDGKTANKKNGYEALRLKADVDINKESVGLER